MKKYYIAPLVSFEEVHEEELLAGTQVNTDCANDDCGMPVPGPISGGQDNGSDMNSKGMGGYWNLEE